MTKLFTAALLLNASLAFATEAPSKQGLAEIYALPYPQVEAMVLAADGEACASLISSVEQGKNDPAQLSPAEFCAVKNYSGAGFAINRPLWLTDASGSALSAQEWAYVRVLDAALAKMKSAPPTLVYRGAARDQIQFKKKGEIVRLKGYTSTTPSKDVAEGFVQDRLMVIKVISGKSLKAYSNAGLEEELLLPRSTYVRFEKAEVKDMEIFTEEGPETRKIEIVHLTEVPRK